MPTQKSAGREQTQLVKDNKKPRATEAALGSKNGLSYWLAVSPVPGDTN
jgi:hypothetical protein